MPDNIFAIKDEYKDVIVGFNNSGLPLGQRSDSDLALLAQMAEHNPSLRKYFVEFPAPAIVQEHKVETFLAKSEPEPEVIITPEEESTTPEETEVIIDPEEKIDE